MIDGEVDPTLIDSIMRYLVCETTQVKAPRQIIVEPGIASQFEKQMLIFMRIMLKLAVNHKKLEHIDLLSFYNNYSGEVMVDLINILINFLPHLESVKSLKYPSITLRGISHGGLPQKNDDLYESIMKNISLIAIEIIFDVPKLTYVLNELLVRNKVFHQDPPKPLDQMSFYSKISLCCWNSWAYIYRSCIFTDKQIFKR